MNFPSKNRISSSFPFFRPINTVTIRRIHTSTVRQQDYRRPRRPSVYFYNAKPSSSSRFSSSDYSPPSFLGKYMIPLIFFILLFSSGFGGIFILFVILGIPMLLLLGLSIFAFRLLSSGVFRAVDPSTIQRWYRHTTNYYGNGTNKNKNGVMNPLLLTWNRWLESIVKQGLVNSFRDERSIRGLVSSLQYKVKEEDQFRPWCGRPVSLSPNPQNISVQSMNISGGAIGSDTFPLGGKYAATVVELSLPVKDAHGRIVGTLHIIADIQVLSTPLSNTSSTVSSTMTALSPLKSALENIKYYFSGQALKDSRQYSKKMNNDDNDTKSNAHLDWEEELEKLVTEDTQGKGPLQNEIYQYTIRSVILQWNDSGKRINVTHVWPRTLRSDTYPYASSMFNDEASSKDTSGNNGQTSRTTKGRTIDAEWYEKKS